MTWKKANISNPGTSTQFGADDMDKVSNLFSAVDVDDVDIAADFKIRSSKKKLMNPGNTFGYTEVGSAIAGDRNTIEPLLTGHDTRVYQAHSQTLTNKAIDILNNTLSLRTNSALVTKNGSTYYAIKRDGTIISSGSVFETVAQAAIDEEACDVVIGGVSNTTEFLFSSTGLVLDDQNTGTNLTILKNASLAVPNGFTGNAIYVHNGAYTNITLSGFIYEVGWDTDSEQRLWNGILYEADNGDSVVYNSFYSKGGQIFAVGTGVKLKQTGTGFTNGNAFYNLNISDMTVGVEFEQNGGTDKIQGNYFSDNLLQCDPDTEYGYKNTSGGGNFFTNCFVWDPQGAIGINLLSTSGDGNTIVGGNVKYDPGNDENINTQIFDQWWTVLGNNLHIFANKTNTQITSNQNNYALGDDITKILFYISSDASRNITGLSSDDNTYGRVIILYNTGSQNIVLKNEDAGSTATNRFSFPADITLGAKQSVTLRYDGEVSSRWQCIGKNF